MLNAPHHPSGKLQHTAQIQPHSRGLGLGSSGVELWALIALKVHHLVLMHSQYREMMS